MSGGGNSFLDKGILLGYCFPVDLHHKKCKKYLLEGDRDFYITDEVDKAFERNKSRLLENHRNALFDHRAELQRSNYEGELGPTELKELKENFLDKSSPAYRYLLEYYDCKSIATVYQIKEEIGDIARDMEQMVQRRKREFDDIVVVWVRENEYEELKKTLGELKEDDEEDFWICVDAHDLATLTEPPTELATGNPEDFTRNGREELILDNTEIDSIKIVAVTSKPNR